MLILPAACPVDYSLCNQTVTVYHADGENYTRMVYNRAFLDFRKTETTSKTGSREANGFLLVIPGEGTSVYVGDKVLLGLRARRYPPVRSGPALSHPRWPVWWL